MLYAWQGGFLDMFPYWGDEKSGNRRSFGYVPSLVGKVFHMTEGSHPLQIDGVSVSKKGKPRYVGYDLDASGVPTFRFKFGEQEFTQRIEPLEDQPFSLRMILGTSGSGKLGWDGADEVKAEGASTTVTLRGRELSVHQGFDRNLRISKASVEAGEKVFMNYGCVACHSTDGANGHGPTLMNLFGREREIEGADKPVKADADYIRESIQKPNAKTAKGFPPNYMPPYVLKPVEIESLVLFIESLSGN
jgi:mono/diheme cytochrome c family protein